MSGFFYWSGVVYWAVIFGVVMAALCAVAWRRTTSKTEGVERDD